MTIGVPPSGRPHSSPVSRRCMSSMPSEKRSSVSSGTRSRQTFMSRMLPVSTSRAAVEASWYQMSGAVPAARSTSNCVSNSGGASRDSMKTSGCASMNRVRTSCLAIASGVSRSSGTTSRPITRRVIWPSWANTASEGTTIASSTHTVRNLPNFFIVLLPRPRQITLWTNRRRTAFSRRFHPKPCRLRTPFHSDRRQPAPGRPAQTPQPAAPFQQSRWLPCPDWQAP